MLEKNMEISLFLGLFENTSLPMNKLFRPEILSKEC